MTAPAALAIEDVTFDHFGTRSAHEGKAIVVRMRGNADAQVRDGLSSLLDQLDAEVKRLVVPEAVLDVRELYFMNSSCLSLLVRWITTLAEEKTKRYKIRFVSNPNLRWQKRSFSALGALGRDVVSVD